MNTSNSNDQSYINTKSYFEQVLLRQSGIGNNTTTVDERSKMYSQLQMGQLTKKQKKILKLVELEDKFKDIAEIKSIVNQNYDMH